MIRILLAVVLTVLSLLAPGAARAQSEEQTLVDRATLAAQELITQTVSKDPKNLLLKARGIMICPQVFKAGFFFGGQGGSCVLLARAGNGTWSYPAFYGMGGGSFGFQFGIQDAQVMMLIMTNRGLNALMDSQFTFGADASIAIATIGAGVEGSTTAAVGADVVAFSATRGLFGGFALGGALVSSRTNSNQSYYGQPYGARQIVMQMQGVNPGADPLREILTRYGTQPEPVQAVAPGNPPPRTAPGYTPAYPPQGGPGYAPAYPPYQASQPQPPPMQQGYAQPPAQPGYAAAPPAADMAPVQQQNLAPPAR